MIYLPHPPAFYLCRYHLMGNCRLAAELSGILSGLGPQGELKTWGAPLRKFACEISWRRNFASEINEITNEISLISRTKFRLRPQINEINEISSIYRRTNAIWDEISSYGINEINEISLFSQAKCNGTKVFVYEWKFRRTKFREDEISSGAIF